MKQLLERWAELEPEFISIDPDSGEYTFLDGYPVISWREWQSIIQQAIEARGLKWHFPNVAHGYKYQAEITIDEDFNTVTGEADSPAEALLSAYLQALEAVKTQEELK